ncbi:MAG: dephospho-CoA kinase [Rickettsiales bacterium]
MRGVIGVTGQIASGKSEICAYLARRYGVSVFDADAVAKTLATSDPYADRIREAFPQCRGDRNALRRLVFGESKARRTLEAILHPPVLDEAKNHIARAESVAVLDVPLLYQSGMDALCDSVWMIEASREARMKRIVSSRGLAPELAERMIASQEELRAFRRRADMLMDGNAGLASLFFAVDAAFSAMRSVFDARRKANKR